ncbi:hypothetical protein AB9P05_14380 [Roseivirga sp. BDSF3-8]|uniref:hypothetical protein n=1 Tax=Roseivirga sp. BDSF3-8 TaxID=3241598 RepID=UPI00353224BB
MKTASRTFRNPVLRWTWNIVFTIFYPIITAFSALLMGLVWLLAAPSRLANLIFGRKGVSLDKIKQFGPDRSAVDISPEERPANNKEELG